MAIHALKLARTDAGSLPDGGICRSSLPYSSACIMRLAARSPGASAGPRLPPVRRPSLEVRLSPPLSLSGFSPWQR